MIICNDYLSKTLKCSPKQCEDSAGLVGHCGPATTCVSSVTSVANNNNTKFARCEGCGEPIFDR